MEKSLKVQVLVATMHQKDYTLTDKMNLETDAIIANQCEKCSNDSYKKNDHKILFLNRPDRGVGLNRNEALLHATGDILTLADDDMIFYKGYEGIIKKAFYEIPDADAIIFNIETIGQDMGRRDNSKVKRVRFYNALNYGAARLSMKKNSVKRENILFHTCFGGGTKFSAGEDTLFIADMLKHGLKVYAYPETIASVDQTSSTWFAGYNHKYYYDKGVFFRALSKKFAYVLCIQDLIRHKDYKKNQMKFSEALNEMKKGICAFENLKAYEEGFIDYGN